MQRAQGSHSSSAFRVGLHFLEIDKFREMYHFEYILVSIEIFQPNGRRDLASCNGIICESYTMQNQMSPL